MKRIDIFTAVGILFIAWGAFGILFAAINYFGAIGDSSLSADVIETVSKASLSGALSGLFKAALGALFIVLQKFISKKEH